jgi:YfiR/HmsC-like
VTGKQIVTHSTKRWWRGLGAILALGAVLRAGLDEYQAKAVFLCKFVRFVEWPSDALKDPSAPVSVCILGQTPVSEALEKMSASKPIDGRNFTIRPVTVSRQLSGCHILFVPGASLKQFRPMRAEPAALAGVLVVGEAEGFALDGGVMNFKMEEGRLRVEINLVLAKRLGLQVNARLLSMAQVVER